MGKLRQDLQAFEEEDAAYAAWICDKQLRKLDEHKKQKNEHDMEDMEARAPGGMLRNGTQQKAAVKESIEIGNFLKMNEEASKPGVRHHVHNVVSLEVPKVVPVKNKTDDTGHEVEGGEVKLDDLCTNNDGMQESHRFADLGKVDGDTIACAFGDSEALRALETGWKALKHPVYKTMPGYIVTEGNRNNATFTNTPKSLGH
eukprot:gene31814-40134_t